MIFLGPIGSTSFAFPADINRITNFAYRTMLQAVMPLYRHQIDVWKFIEMDISPRPFTLPIMGVVRGINPFKDAVVVADR